MIEQLDTALGELQIQWQTPKVTIKVARQVPRKGVETFLHING